MGLYHQTGDCTSQFLPAKKYSMSGSGHRYSSGSSTGDIAANESQELSRGLKGLFCIMKRYKAGVVMKSHISLPPESVKDCH